MNFDRWISRARAQGASDLLVEAGTPAVIRVRGELLAVGELIPAAAVADMVRELIGADGWSRFLAQGSTDVSLDVAQTRCRVNVFRTVRGVAAAVRLLPPAVHDLRGSNLHPDLRRFTDASTGLVVISGPTGSGKSTTLAAMIEEVNATRARNIVALESPLEYVFANRRSFIRQREIPTHSPSYEQAISDALRENPDVLVVGEMRTAEVMRLTLNAAETGHLVLATMHSATCAEALTRLCMSFSPEIQAGIRAQVADCLVGVVCQRLDFLPEHGIRVPRCEVLTASSAAKGTIRAGQFSQIATVLQAGGEEGMWTFDRYQRWIAQKRDWVLPGTALPERDRPAVRAPVSDSSMPPAAPRRNDAPIEISIDEDLDLAEIAKRIDEGKG